MTFADRVQDVTTSTGTGTFTLSGSPPAGGYQAISSIGPVGTSFPYGVSSGNLWETGIATITAANTVSRSPSASSSAGSLVSFPAGASFVCTLTAAQLAQIPQVTSIPFSSSIPLSQLGTAYMSSQTVSSPLTLTPASNAVRGALVYLRLIADGTNAPNYSAFKEWGGSLGYDNRAGIENQMQFFFDGFNSWVSISQAVNAVAVPLPASAITLTGPSSGIVNQASSAFTVGVTPVGGAITGTVVVTPSDGAGGAFTPSSVSLSNGTTSATFTYTPASIGAKTVNVTNNGGLTNPSGVTYTVAASATVPGAPTIGTAVAGSGYIDVAFTAPSSNGGATILDYTATLSTGQTATGTTSPIRVTATNGTATTATVTARNSVGSSAASSASNSVTPVATQATRLNKATVSMTESGTGPYSYVGTGHTFDNTAWGAISSTGLRSSADGSLAYTLAAYATGGSEVMIGILNSTYGVVPWNNMPYGFYTQFSSGKYLPITNGSLGSASSIPVANGDIPRLRRSGTSLIAEVSKDGGVTWANVFTWTNITVMDYNFVVYCALTSQANNIAGVGLAT